MRSFNDVGLPDGHAFPALAYHEPTRTLIAHTRPTKALLPGERLSFRRVGETQYHPIGDFSDGVSLQSFALDPCRPSLYFSAVTWRELEPGTSAGDWDGLYRFDLEQHRCDRLAQRGDLHARESDETWLSGLLSVANDGKGIICQAALRRSQSDFAYWVAHLNLADLSLTAIAELEAVFA
jgi:hypothetical protein